MKAYINGIILDGTKEMEPVQGKCIVCEGEKIVDIKTQSEMDLSQYDCIDLKGKYIMPGLINLHVHIPASGKPTKKPMDAKKTVKFATANALTRKYLESLCKNFAKMELYSGVTTIRSVGGVENYDSQLRDKINRNEIVGPRILSADMAISVPEGHMAGSLAYEAHNKEEAVHFVDEIVQSKPDLIKLMITGGVLDAKEKGTPGELKMSKEIVRAACDEAHKYHLPVAAHVESTEGVKVALENGVDTIEHGAKPTDEIIALFKEKHAAHVATLSPALPYALFDPAISRCNEKDQYNGKLVFDGIVECAKACLENSIPVGLGTDTGCPYITHYDMWRELNYFKKYCGVTEKFALYTATLQNAKIAHIEDETGSIEVGKSADFVVTQKNPLEDLEALRNISMVVIRGKCIDKPVVKKMPQVEKELDKFVH